MIHEIFISTADNRILFGNSRLFPQSPQYPISEVCSKRLSQLKVNDCVLSILYSDLDACTAAKYLLDLQNFIQSGIRILSASVVEANYFTILKLLQNPDIVFPAKAEPTSMIKTENIYIDVVENIHAILHNDKVVKNSLFGEVVYKDSRAASLVFSKGEKYQIGHKSSYPIKSHLNKIELEHNQNGQRSLLTYSIGSIGYVMFRMAKNGESYRFYSDQKLHFKSIVFSIPVPKTTFMTNLIHKNGRAKLDLEASYVRWRFSNYEFENENITIEKKMMSDSDDHRSVLISFQIDNWTESQFHIEDSTCPNRGEAKFWVKYITQDGHYEIRQ